MVSTCTAVSRSNSDSFDLIVCETLVASVRIVRARGKHITIGQARAFPTLRGALSQQLALLQTEVLVGHSHELFRCLLALAVDCHKASEELPAFRVMVVRMMLLLLLLVHHRNFGKRSSQFL
jgi:hypothetical protein